jgi:hypothetical protein
MTAKTLMRVSLLVAIVVAWLPADVTVAWRLGVSSVAIALIALAWVFVFGPRARRVRERRRSAQDIARALTASCSRLPV